MRVRSSLSLVLFLSCALCAAQDQTADSTGGYFTFPDPSPFSCLVAWFPPLLIEHGTELKEFVRSDEFARIRRVYGDDRAVDAVFVRAMQLTDNNTGLSLLLSAIATMDHEMVAVSVPVIELILPLTSESQEEFAFRRSRLPTRLYTDTPPEGDRDKLQHFFGSAFLAFAFESSGTSERFGEFVEHGEDAFIVGGVMDDRDFRANRQGQLFGVALLDNNRRFPSDFLRTVVASEPPYDLTSSPGVW